MAMSVAYGTLIATSMGRRAVETIMVGGDVLAGSIAEASVQVDLTWEPATVTWSDGRLVDQLTMLYLRLGGEQSLICTKDAVVLLPNGELRRSDELSPGDRLVDKDGNTVPIETVQLGTYRGGIHDLAADAPSGAIDGNLLVANGVVIGDHTLETEFSTPG
jgi:hypothetical protein